MIARSFSHAHRLTFSLLVQSSTAKRPSWTLVPRCRSGFDLLLPQLSLRSFSSFPSCTDRRTTLLSQSPLAIRTRSSSRLLSPLRLRPVIYRFHFYGWIVHLYRNQIIFLLQKDHKRDEYGATTKHFLRPEHHSRESSIIVGTAQPAAHREGHIFAKGCHISASPWRRACGGDCYCTTGASSARLQT